MISTSMLAMAAGFMAATPSPAWQSDYPSVLALAGREQKPVAVLIGRGEAGKQLPAAAALAFRTNFICLYADISTPAGRDLADTFQLAEGLVISDKSGKVQALRHGGVVSPADLTRYADQFGAPAAVSRTEYVGTATAPVVADTPAPAAATPVLAAPVYQPAPVVQYAPARPVVISGGCANGRCGR